MKSQISDALCVGRPLPLISGDVSQLDALRVTVKLWTSIDVELQSPHPVFGLIFFFFLAFCFYGSSCLPPIRMSTSQQRLQLLGCKENTSCSFSISHLCVPSPRDGQESSLTLTQHSVSRHILKLSSSSSASTPARLSVLGIPASSLPSSLCPPLPL